KICAKSDFTAEKFKSEFARLMEDPQGQAAAVAEKTAELVKTLDKNEELIEEIITSDCAKMSRPKEKKAAGAIGVVFLITVAAKLLGVVREMYQARIFGTSVDADLYSSSYNSTLYIFTTLCYALCIAAVPILTKEFASDRRRGQRAANNLLTITVICAAGAVILWQILASTPLVGLLWKSLSAESVRLTAYIRIMALAMPVIAAAYFMVALFQSLDRYELQGSMSLPYNVFLALFLALFGSKFGIGGVVIACTAAWLLQLGMSAPYIIKEKLSFRPVLDLRESYVGTYFKTAGVTVLTTSVFLFCYLIDTFTAASSDGVAISSFHYADKLFTPLTTTVIYSISAVMFPRFNREFTKDDRRGYLGYIWNVTESTVLFVLPVCAMMYVFGESIIRVLFEGGRFTAQSTAATGGIFRMYALGMCAFCVLDLLNKAYYTMKNTLIPLLVNLGILALNFALDRILQTPSGIALGTAISLTAGAVFMAAMLFKGAKTVRLLPIAKGLAATAAMGVVMWGGTRLLLSGGDGKLMLIVKCVLCGAAGCAVYIAVSSLLRQRAVTDMLKKFTKRA
ncbi:MAG: polysaccharide biosynthesis protein, partial [Oscillospiraceae bacterium]|nr:polysaccharide biosynthesis protein [Oscillospiraceae bacterium]